MPSTASTSDTLKNAARDAIDSAEEKTVETLDTAREKAEKLADKAHQLESELSDSLAEFSGTVTRYINEKPVQAAGIAFAAGVLATLILRKR